MLQKEPAACEHLLSALLFHKWIPVSFIKIDDIFHILLGNYSEDPNSIFTEYVNVHNQIRIFGIICSY